MDVGVIIGRFQVDDLTEGHIFLISEALKNHRRVIVMLGMDPMLGTKSNPLDYPTRERMLRARFPDVTVLPLPDIGDDDVWSRQVDDLIRLVVPEVSHAVLYGGRDSFVPHYHGKFKAIEVDAGISYQNASQKRSDIGKVILNSVDFRKGIIHATQNARPRVMPIVVTVVEDNQGRVLTHARHHSLRMLPYTEVMPNDASLESAARRAVMTVVDIDVTDPKYVGSYPGLALWEFKKADEFHRHAIVFACKYVSGSIRWSSAVQPAFSGGRFEMDPSFALALRLAQKD